MKQRMAKDMSLLQEHMHGEVFGKNRELNRHDDNNA